MPARIIAKLRIYAQEEKKQQEESRLWRLQYDAELERKEKIKNVRKKRLKISTIWLRSRNNIIKASIN